MPNVDTMSREDMVSAIIQTRGEGVAPLFEIASDDEVKSYLESLLRSADLLGEPLLGFEEEDGEAASNNDDAVGETPDAAATKAKAPATETALAAQPEAPSAEPAPSPPPEPAAQHAAPETAPAAASPTPAPKVGESDDALRHQVMVQLKELAAETKTASPHQLAALRLALRIAKAKMNSDPKT